MMQGIRLRFFESFIGDKMKHEDFSIFLSEIQETISNILDKKSADYSNGNDKTYNFKLAGRIDGITAIEALRGMALKHRTSITQGLDELKTGKCRDYGWWEEKIIDEINYNILLLAMIRFEEL